MTRVPLSKLRPAPWNPRTLREPRFQNLCKSIEADPGLLDLRPILATKDGTIYGGNQRFRAAQHLGWKDVPAVLSDISEKLAKERALKDNGAWGDWKEDDLGTLLAELKDAGSDIDLLGFDSPELDRLLASVTQVPEEDDVDLTPPSEPITKPGDLWLLGEHRLLCGDSTNITDVERLMNGERAALMATDPPYAVGYSGGEHPRSPSNSPQTRNKQWDDYKDVRPELFLEFLTTAYAAALVKEAAIYQWYAFSRHVLVETAWREAGLLPHQQIIWVKSRPVLTRSHFMWQHEPCFYGWLQGHQPVDRPPANSTSVWQVALKDQADDIHPTQKPVDLFVGPFQWHLPRHGLAYEPFSGSGTCIVVAERTERRCYAMEQAPAFVDVAVARWERLTGKKATLAATEQVLAGNR